MYIYIQLHIHIFEFKTQMSRKNKHADQILNGLYKSMKLSVI